MHRVLEIPELQLAIAQELIPPESYWYRRRRDLYRLSLVSHSWRSIAEPMRWEEGSDLGDILCILPADAWVRVDLEDTDWQGNTIVRRARSICRRLNSLDWRTLQERTRFVQSFTLSQDAGMQQTLANLLSTIPPADMLFPKLTELVLAMDEDDQEDFSSIYSAFVLAVTTPSITRLVIRNSLTHAPSHIYTATLTKVIRRSHGLRSIVFEASAEFEKHMPFPPESPSPYRSFFHALGSCDLLTSVKFEITTYEYDSCILPTLAALPSLRELTLKNEYQAEWAEMDALEALDELEALLLRLGSIRIPTPSFPSLRSMRSLELPHRLVRALIAAGGCSIPLTSFELKTDIDDYQRFHDILSAVCMGCHGTTLTGLSVECCCMTFQGHPTTSVLNLSAIAPISSFARLSRIKLDGLVSVDLSDAAYAEIACWWPELVSLALVTERSTSTCSLAALLHLQSSCPRLEYVDLALNAEEVPTIASSDTRSTTSTRHTSPPRFELQVRNSPITEDVGSVALFLLSLFPKIQTVKFEVGFDDDAFLKENAEEWVILERREAWGKVNELIANHRNACL
ncbi:hypothetical protein K525DRAFT_260125 [Schizophyllum commune Loenen D]|nr:hypothetical protein K525DRAFT_260125 [Schizophyllum commune Loenen D]